MRLSIPGRMAVVIIALTALLPWHQAAAATRIFWHYSIVSDESLAARTMDFNTDDLPTIYALPEGQNRSGGVSNPAVWTSKYGSIVIRHRGLNNLCGEGFNTQGLAFHYLYMAGSEYETRDSRPGVNGAIYGQYLLDNAKNVAEALVLMEQTQLVPGWMSASYPCHLALEDANGDTAIVEFVGGQKKVYHGSTYNVLTNEPSLDDQIKNRTRYRGFGGADSWPGDVDSKSRFVRASVFLKTMTENMDPFDLDIVSDLSSVISAAATPFGAIRFMDDGSEVAAWPTLWTSIFDLEKMVIYFSHTLARNQFTITMANVNLEPGAPTLYLKADRTDLFGDVSKLLHPIPSLPGLPLLLLSE